MAQAFQAHHGAASITTLSAGERVEWTYQIEVHCEGTVSRVLDRTIVPREPEELSGMMNGWIFIPWFQPWNDPKYLPSYPPGGALFSGSELPPLGAEGGDSDTHYEWSNLPAPDTGAEFDLPLPPEAVEAFNLPFENTYNPEDYEDDEIPSLPPPPEATLAALDGVVDSDGVDALDDEYRLERKGRRWIVMSPDGDPINEETYLKRDALQILEDLNSGGGLDDLEDEDEDEDED